MSGFIGAIGGISISILLLGLLIGVILFVGGFFALVSLKALDKIFYKNSCWRRL